MTVTLRCGTLHDAGGGKAYSDRRKAKGRQARLVKSLAFGLLASVLSGCVNSYPSLRSVPDEARPSLPVEERRQIVRDLIDERDRSRQQTTVVRHRSGLSSEALTTSASDEILAEDIIPDLPESEEPANEPVIDKEGIPDRAYRSNSQVEDGGLNDFIRELQRDTTPAIPLPEDEEVSGEQAEDKTSFLLPRYQESVATEQILLAAFVPAISSRDGMQRDGGILFVATEDEPGFFCRWMGLLVAWSGMCVDEPGAGSDDDITADLEEEGRRLEEEEIDSRRRSSDETRRERTERRLSEEEAADAIENAGRGVLAPVTGSLEKLRDFIRSRRSNSETPASEDRTSALREVAPESPEVAPLDHAPIPRSRPKRRDDIIIVDRSEQFSFNRTPIPAFKPTPDEPVILPPVERQQSRDNAVEILEPPRVPRARPNDLVADRNEAETLSARESAADVLKGLSANLARAKDESLEPAAGPEPLEQADAAPATVTSRELTAASEASDTNANTTTSAVDQLAEIEAFTITFEAEKPGLPDGMMPRLAALLADAKADNQQIHIVGEASSNHLARRRATDVGAALVQLGATVEILEYDHRASAGVDRVRLVLKPMAPDTNLSTSG